MSAQEVVLGQLDYVEKEFQRRDGMGENAEVETRKMTSVWKVT